MKICHDDSIKNTGKGKGKTERVHIILSFLQKVRGQGVIIDLRNILFKATDLQLITFIKKVLEGE